MTDKCAINNFMYHMLHYQKTHDVVKCCVQNAMYLRHAIVSNDWSQDAKVIPVLALVPCKNMIKTIVHLVIDCEGEIYDPSYEVASNQHAEYFRTFIEYKKDYLDLVEFLEIDNAAGANPEEYAKGTLRTFIEFIECSHKLNEGAIIVVDRDHFINQGKYVESKIFNRNTRRKIYRMLAKKSSPPKTINPLC